MAEKIRYVDGPRLARAVVAGANSVALLREELDTINVFPVADGDTGTNLLSTLRAVAAAAHQTKERAVGDVARVLAEAAVAGARGNSGAILASFFSGFAEALEGKARLSVEDLALAAARGAGAAREAVENPRPGTILSVADGWARGVAGANGSGPEDVEARLRVGLAAAEQALADTPKQMAMLAKAGVVDAGALGFVEMLRGIHRLIERRSTLTELREAVADLPPPPHLEGDGAEIRFQFCTEVLIEGAGLDRRAVKHAVTELGDSLVVAGGKSRLRVHIHTDQPQQVFEVAKTFGTVGFTKADDMKAQNALAFRHTTSEGVVIMSDTTCDLAADELGLVDRVPLVLRFGNDEYLDGVTLMPEDFAVKLASSPHHPKTSQPAPSDFRRAFERHLRRGARILSINVSAKLSGTCQAAQKAAASLGGDKVRVVDGKSASAGLRLVVDEARRALAAGSSFEQVAALAEGAARRVKVYAMPATLKYLVRGGRIPARRGRIGELLRLRPLMVIDEEGNAKAGPKALGFRRIRAKLMDLLAADGAARPGARLRICHAAAERGARSLADEIARRFGLDVAAIPITVVSPVLAAHAGPGTVAVAILPPE